MPKDNNKDVIAVLCSDIHLSARPPLARSVENDWMDVQKRALQELDELCTNNSNCPLIIAGDLFDKANVPAEVVNLAIEYLPDNIYAIPGQHDLPLHSMMDIHKSSYHTLVLSDRIKNLSSNQYFTLGDWNLLGFPWGSNIQFPKRYERIKDEKSIKWLAVCHSYIWNKSSEAYEGAPKDKHLVQYAKKLDGFTTAVFGDNHRGFYYMCEHEDEPWIVNCGALIRRKIDEINYTPSAYLLHKMGNVTQVDIPCKHDKFIDVSDAINAIEHLMDAGDFIKELKGLGKSLVDFREAVIRFCEKNNVGEVIVSILKEAMEDK